MKLCPIKLRGLHVSKSLVEKKAIPLNISFLQWMLYREPSKEAAVWRFPQTRLKTLDIQTMPCLINWKLPRKSLMMRLSRSVL